MNKAIDKTHKLYASSNWLFYSYMFGQPTGKPYSWFAWYPVKTQSGKWVWWKTIGCVHITKKPWLEGPDWAFYAYSDEKVET